MGPAVPVAPVDQADPEDRVDRPVRLDPVDLADREDPAGARYQRVVSCQAVWGGSASLAVCREPLRDAALRLPILCALDRCVIAT
jgi:hypothetical protein